jgi:protein arginine N-methyltransferase 1
MYSLDELGQMIADNARTAAYAEAIARAVRPGDVAVDIGCGVGVFALLACQAGAKRVYAIEAADVVRWGKQLAAANGFSEKIEFLRGDSRQINLPERANVLISDLRGTLPFFSDAIASIEDARERFLAPGGIQIPQSDTLYAAIVDAANSYAAITSPWRNSPGKLDFSSILPTILNATYNIRIAKNDLLTEPQEWCRLEYASRPNKRAAANIQFRILRQGTGHGIWLWFETQLFEDIGFSTGPLADKTAYGRFFLPWPEPVGLAAGQHVQVELHADNVGGSYIWRWDTHFQSKNGQAARSFHQSTFQSAKFSHDALLRRSASFVPALSERGEAQSWILQAMNGKRSLEEIAREAASLFPQAFRGEDEALRTAGELSEKFAL